MALTPLAFRPSFEENPKLAKASHNLRSLLVAIGQKTITPGHERKINEIIAGANGFPGPDPELLTQLRSAQTGILKLLEKDLQLVPKKPFSKPVDRNRNDCIWGSSRHGAWYITRKYGVDWDRSSDRNGYWHRSWYCQRQASC